MDGKEVFDGKLKEWFEQFYFFSRWSKRMNVDEVVEYYTKVCTEYSEVIRKSLNGELSVVYGEKKVKMDIFYFIVMNDYNVRYVDSVILVFLFIYGGFWQVGSRKMYNFVSNVWIKVGCIVVIVGYNLVLEVRVEQMVIEI